MRYLNFFFAFLISSLCWGHARLVSPVPRNNNAGIKTGPCGGLARSATPMVVTGGTNMTVQWEETINHPGKFIFSLSLGSDLNFDKNILATIVDEQNAGVALPHKYTALIAIPNIDCPTCTLQMIQSMEENPAVPSFYYSCADIIIQKSSAPPPPPTPSPPPDDIGTLSSSPSQQTNAVKFGQGCGTVKSVASPQENLSWILGCLLMMLIPVFVWARLRSIYFSATI